MTRTIRMKDIAGLKANTTTAPYATTEPAKIGGVRGGGTSPPADPFQISENWDSTPSWDSQTFGERHAVDGHSIPQGWDFVRNVPPEWGQTVNRAAIETTTDAQWQRSGSGQSMLFRRFAREGAWAGDGIVGRFLEEDQKEIYVSFWIKLQPGWEEIGQTKFFRVYAWDRQKANIFQNPVVGFLWDYQRNDFGVRNNLALFSNPRGFEAPVADYWSRPINSGGVASNYSIAAWEVNPDLVESTIINQLTGNPITLANGDEGILPAAAIFGDAWHKLEFYLKFNSAAGVKDGQFRQWFDGTEIFRGTGLAWMQDGYTGEQTGWNYISFGGNDFFNEREDGSPSLDSEQYSEDYAIDDIVIQNYLPVGIAEV